MIDAISSVKSLGTEPAARTAVPAQTNAAAATKEAAQAPISPRLRPDFLSGAIVTEFVGNNGQVTLQTPTVAALAYLRAGLDATGQQKVDPNASAAARLQVQAPAELIA